MPRIDSQDRAPCAVVAVGDVNGDGHGDFALAHRVRPFRADQASRRLPAIEHRPILWVLSGADGKVLSVAKGRGFRELAYRRGDHVVSFWGNRRPDKNGFGCSFAACGDLDGRPGSELLVDPGDFRRPDKVLVVSAVTGEETGGFQVPGGRVLGRSVDGGEQLWRVGFEGGYRHAEGTGLDWAEDRDNDGLADLCLVGDLDMDGLSEIAVLLPRSRTIAMLTAVDRSVLWTRKIEELEVPEPDGR